MTEIKFINLSDLYSDHLAYKSNFFNQWEAKKTMYTQPIFSRHHLIVNESMSVNMIVFYFTWISGSHLHKSIIGGRAAKEKKKKG